jgi:hypothetical protein
VIDVPFVRIRKSSARESLAGVIHEIDRETEVPEVVDHLGILGVALGAPLQDDQRAHLVLDLDLHPRDPHVLAAEEAPGNAVLTVVGKHGILENLRIALFGDRHDGRGQCGEGE